MIYFVGVINNNSSVNIDEKSLTHFKRFNVGTALHQFLTNQDHIVSFFIKSEPN